MDVSIDIETLGVQPNALVVSIGACSFEPLDKRVIRQDTYHEWLRREDQSGRLVDLATVDWWQSQKVQGNPAAAFLDQPPSSGTPVKHALASLAEFFERVQPTCVWANSPSFDCVIVRSLFRDFGYMDAPWKFRCERDQRTLEYVLQVKGIELPLRCDNFGNRHDALADAVTQAAYIQDMLSRL